jgi:hypothetical protein
VFSGGVNQWSFFHDIHARIEQLLDELGLPDEAPTTIKQFVVRGSRVRSVRRTVDAALNKAAAT